MLFFKFLQLSFNLFFIIKCFQIFVIELLIVCNFYCHCIFVIYLLSFVLVPFRIQNSTYFEPKRFNHNKYIYNDIVNQKMEVNLQQKIK